MSWQALLALIAEELGQEAADRIEVRARQELGGVRLTIATRVVVTPDKIAGQKPQEAAKRLKIHPSTVYRRLIR